MAADAHTVTPGQYDAWYDTPRGRWIGSTEWALLRSALELQAGNSVLDVGCGTGWFTRRAAAEGARVAGLDLDESALEFARQRGPGPLEFVRGDATGLPFEDRSFDKVMSVTALCFVPQWPRAIAEIVRVCCRRFALGLLNRKSVLWLQKGRGGGLGAYRDAHWHTTAEIAAVLGGQAASHGSSLFVRCLPDRRGCGTNDRTGAALGATAGIFHGRLRRSSSPLSRSDGASTTARRSLLPCGGSMRLVAERTSYRHSCPQSVMGQH